MAFSDDFAERSRAIFEQLRTGKDPTADDGSEAPPADHVAEETEDQAETAEDFASDAARLPTPPEELRPPARDDEGVWEAPPQISTGEELAALADGDAPTSWPEELHEAGGPLEGPNFPVVTSPQNDGSTDLAATLPDEAERSRVAGSPDELTAPSDGANTVPSWAPLADPTSDEAASPSPLSENGVAPVTTLVQDPPDPQRFARPLPRVLAIANQKGGVGKTTTTVNLGASLAVLGFRVLVIDLDPQGNATTGLGVNSRNLDSSIYDVILHDVPLDDCIEPTSLRNLFVAPATIDLAGAEIELVPAFSREQRLKRALAEVKEDYDFVLIDCPPSLGLLTVNALSAASEVVVPIQCEYYALEGLGQLLRNINLVQSNLNPDLELSAIVLTMYDARTKLAEQVADEVREHFGPRVCRNVVPRTVRLSEAPSFGQPIIVFDPSSRGALAYRELAREVSGGPPQRSG